MKQNYIDLDNDSKASADLLEYNTEVLKKLTESSIRYQVNNHNHVFIEIPGEGWVSLQNALHSGVIEWRNE